LGSQRANLLQEVTDCPHEDPRIPEVSLMKHPLGFLARRFFDEAPNLECSALGRLAWLDVGESRVRTRGNNSDSHEDVLRARHPFCCEESFTKSVVVSNRPIRVN